jgi:uncharacterized protein (AIM24 family)
MITQAVEDAVPSRAAATNMVESAPGHRRPIPVTELATMNMLQPGAKGHALELGPGGVLLARVDGKITCRTHGVMVSSGELGFEPATRRVRGRKTDEIFGEGDESLFVVSGSGFLVASACGERFTALRLDEDVLYLREQFVFAFEDGLRWENGRIPGADERVVQFRGEGCVAMRTPRELLSVRLSSEQVLYVEVEALAGWIGRVVPRIVKPAAGGRASTPFVECSGEGVVLIDDAQGSD